MRFLLVVLVLEEGPWRDGVLEYRVLGSGPIASALPDWNTVRVASGSKRALPGLPSRSLLTFAPFPAPRLRGSFTALFTVLD
jgi:hypothetical protein